MILIIIINIAYSFAARGMRVALQVNRHVVITNHTLRHLLHRGRRPAGLMLGYLLARAGIDVTVLEKHADFLRDFRGDTIHPSTLEVMHQLGLLDELLTLPHQRAESLHAESPDATSLADFTARLPTLQIYRLYATVEFLNFWPSRPPPSPTLGC